MQKDGPTSVENQEMELLSQGRDEMNLAEFPIGLIADRAENGVKTVVYRDRDETLTITGSDLLGLPTALDIDVIIALMYLTRIKNDFSESSLEFTRYELMQVLGWPDRGYYYERLTESLTRWVGVTLVYKKSWWDNDTKTKGNRTFHILESATIIDLEQRRAMQHRQMDIPNSSIRWSKEFFQSFEANNLKKLDLKVYYSLNSSISKQLYRFLDKRFYKKSYCSFELQTLACEHIGISRNYEAWRLKQKIQPAIDELVKVGFLKSMRPDERFTRIGLKQWRVNFQKKECRKPSENREPVQIDRIECMESAKLESQLISRGVASKVARELVGMFPDEIVRHQVEVLDWLMNKGVRSIRNPGAYLTKAIRENYVTPREFQSSNTIQKYFAVSNAPKSLEIVEKDKLGARRNRDMAAQVRSFWERLSEAEREKLDAEAIQFTAPEIRRKYEVNQTKNANLAEVLFRISIREPFIRNLIEIRPEMKKEQGIRSILTTLNNDESHENLSVDDLPI